MKKYKLKLLFGQLNSLNKSLSSMFQSQWVLENVDHIIFYNVKSFLKRLHDKLYMMNDMIVDVHFKYSISIDINECSALKQVYALCQESIDNDMYLNVLYIEVFGQIQKQEIELMDRHKYLNPPIALIQKKLNNDNFKNLEQ